MSITAWEDGRWTALPHLQGTVRADVCVVGLGGSGLSAIAALVANGFSVVGLDSAQVAGGAAGANGGFLLAGTARFYHQVVSIVGRARARELYQLTIDEIARMATEMPDIVRRVGSLRIAMSDDELVNCDEQFAMMRRDDLPVERYEGPEGKGLLIPTDAVFNPLTRCRRLAESCLQRGAHLFEHSEVLELGTSIVRTAQGIVRCKHIIAAVDGKLDLLFPALSPRVRTARLQMLATAPTTEVHFERAAYARWGYEYWQQLPDGRVVLGGFRDHAVEQEWTHSVATTQSIQDKLTRFLRDYLHIHAPVEHRWAASVGYTVNGLPIIEEVQSNVWALGGYNGTGNVVGALCGRAVAEQVMATNASGKTSNLIALLRGNG